MTALAKFVHNLINRRYGIGEESVLNQGSASGSAGASLGIELKQIVNALKAEAFTPTNGRAGYARLGESQVYREFCAATQRLQRFDPLTLVSREEKLAFWINLYNALIINAVIDFGVKQSVHEIPGFFWKAAYCINGYRFNAFDIEYGVLRANAGHPAIPGAHFCATDPRARYKLDELDARIHFALVCAARSCPPIAVYTAEKIDEQFDLAAAAFVNGGGVEIDQAAGIVRLSKIFQWYAPDFGGPPFGLGAMQPVLRYLSPYMLDQQARAYLLSGRPKSPKIKFLSYDWTLNA